MTEYKVVKFPKTRVASIDVYATGLKKHHVAALIEIDVTESREKIKKYKKEFNKISFTAWLIKAISLTIKDHESVAAFLKDKRNLIIFNDINISILVEKELNGHKIPIPLIIEKSQQKSIELITKEISDAKNKDLTESDIVLEKKSKKLERIYYLLPGFFRRYFWRFMLKHPRFAFNKMGNVAITSIGMIGNVKGWFIPKSIHPICFGTSNLTKKPIIINNKIEIREILNMTILLDHDVIDGAPMARFISKLCENLEKGIAL